MEIISVLYNGGQGEQVLSKIRDAIRIQNASGEYVLRKTEFSYDDIEKTELPAGKSLLFTDENIDEILDRQKGPYTFMILSLLYPDIKLGQVKFHQDHIHPDSGFKNKALKEQGLPEEKWEEWQEKKDTLPNLQLMEGSENVSKLAKPFIDWFNGMDNQGHPNVADKKRFMESNYIPTGVTLDFNNFEEFYQNRRSLLKNEIKMVLHKSG